MSFWFFCINNILLDKKNGRKRSEGCEVPNKTGTGRRNPGCVATSAYFGGITRTLKPIGLNYESTKDMVWDTQVSYHAHRWNHCYGHVLRMHSNRWGGKPNGMVPVLRWCIEAKLYLWSDYVSFTNYASWIAGTGHLLAEGRLNGRDWKIYRWKI